MADNLSQSHASGGPVLPLETFGEICLHLGPSELYTMSLASRDYQNEAERQLYRSPNLIDTSLDFARLVGFFSTVSSVTRKAGYVFALSLPDRITVPADHPIRTRRPNDIYPLDAVSVGLSALVNMTSLDLRANEISPPWCHLSILDKVHVDSPPFRLLCYAAYDPSMGPAGNLDQILRFFETQMDIFDFKTCTLYHDSPNARALQTAPLFPHLQVMDVMDPRWLQLVHCRHVRRLAISVVIYGLEASYMADLVGRCDSALKHLKIFFADFSLRTVEDLLRSIASQSAVALESLTLESSVPFEKDIHLSDGFWTALNGVCSFSTLIMHFEGSRDPPCGAPQIHRIVEILPNIQRFAFYPARREGSPMFRAEWVTYRRNGRAGIELEGYGTLDDASWRKLYLDQLRT